MKRSNLIKGLLRQICSRSTLRVVRRMEGVILAMKLLSHQRRLLSDHDALVIPIAFPGRFLITLKKENVIKMLMITRIEDSGSIPVREA